jgi:hypothetical protein
MTQALQNQPFAKLKPVTRCTASYVRENEELKAQAFRFNRKLTMEIHYAFMQKDKLQFNAETRKFWRNKHDTLTEILEMKKELEGGEGC